MVRETDKRQEIYFEKGQTKQLVEQWKSKQLSPDRELTAEAATNRDVEGLEQGRNSSDESIIDSVLFVVVRKS